MIDAALRTPRIEFTPCDPHAYSLDALAGSQSSVPSPPPSPRRMAAFSKPTTIVDAAFNILTLSDSTNAALEAALISRRTDILGAMSQ